MIEKIVAYCCRHAILVVVIGIVAGGLAAFYAVTHFAINTNSDDLISADVGWRKLQAVYDEKFPQQNNLMLVVIDGKTPEQARDAAVALEHELAPKEEVFLSVRRPTTAPFFERNGLLFLSLAEVQTTTEQIIEAQPFLGGLAIDPSLRGIMGSLSTALTGVEEDEAELSDLEDAIGAFGNALEGVVAGRLSVMSWQSLITGRVPTKEEMRTFLEIQPRLDFEALSPGAAASDAVRQAARNLGLMPDNGVTVRLTGPIPLADEEFATLGERAVLMTTAMVLAVLFTLWLAVKSFRIILCIFLTIMIGLAITMTFGLLAVGVFNIISIAFITLFVGLGVDFGIQFSVRYRSERHDDDNIESALIKAGRNLGKPLGLAAAATAAGFLSFLPTDYVGVAELGLIAGVGMFIAFSVTIVMMPALLKLTRPPAEKSEIGYTFLAPADRYLREHRWGVLLVLSAIGVGALMLVPAMRFDANPLNLRNAKTESVSTLLDLAQDKQTSPNTVNALAPSVEAAGELGGRLEEKPEVGQVLTLLSFVPEDQGDKLILIEDASLLLDPTLNPFEVKPAPSDEETSQSLAKTARQLREAANAEASPVAEDARRLAGLLEQLVAGDRPLRERAEAALVPGLRTILDQLRLSLQAQPVTIENLPEDLVRDWVAPDGSARIQIFPEKTGSDDATLNEFRAAVQSVVPNATGAPISIPASGDTIVRAFLEAGLTALLAIAILLFVVLRSARDVALTLIPILWAGVVTLGTCVLLGLQLNFANIIALPLFLGIGVAFSIYYVAAWRAGRTDLLQSSLTRAIVYSALTTASAFGSLWLSSHPGTASMGQLLMISLGWALVATLFFLNPLLGPVPKGKPAA